VADEYELLKKRWLVLAFVVPISPYLANLSPFLTQMVFGEDDGSLTALTLVVFHLLVLVLVVVQVKLTKQLTACRLLRVQAGDQAPDSSGFWVVTIVEMSWVVLMGLLAAWGWTHVG
jgi:hypothetical protein